MRGANGLGPVGARSTAAHLLTLQLFLFAGGVPLFFLAVLVEERQAAQAALERSEARYRAAQGQREALTRRTATGPRWTARPAWAAARGGSGRHGWRSLSDDDADDYDDRQGARPAGRGRAVRRRGGGAPGTRLRAPGGGGLDTPAAPGRRRRGAGGGAQAAPPRLDLLGAPIPGTGRDLLHERCAGLLAAGVFVHRPDKNGRPAFGERFKRLLFAHEGVAFPLDVFVATATTWGAILTIRTGPGDFSHRLVTSRLFGGWMAAGMRQRDGSLWDGGRVVETPEEEDFFAAVGLPWLAPERRTGTVRPYRRDGAWGWRDPAAGY